MECKFFVGQKVTPLQDNWHIGNFQLPNYASYPKIGRVYTVRGITVDQYGIPGLLLQGSATGYNLPSGEECGFDHRVFKPVEDKRTEAGMEILRKIAQGMKPPKAPEEPKRKKKVAA